MYKNVIFFSLTWASCSSNALCIGVVLVAAEAVMVVAPFPPPLIASRSMPLKKLWLFLQEVPP